jgi:CRP-like cAMP-binding protein
MHSPKINLLLASLPEPDYERLAPHLELMGLSSGTEIFHTGKSYTGIYFPTTCTVSAQVELEAGVSTDIYLLGHRGLFGTGTPQRGSFYKAIVRKSGFAYRCPTHILTEELLRAEGVLLMSLMATRIMMEEMAKNISCRTFHTASQQIARWLMNYGQCEPVDTIAITHNELANAIGIRRERVTLVLNQFEAQGCIRLNRGHIHIHDHTSLSQLACTCDQEHALNKIWTQADLVPPTELTAKLKAMS